MMKEQQMQVCKLCKQQGIKPAVKQFSPDARIAALEFGKETEGILDNLPGIGCKVQGAWLTPKAMKRGNQHELC